jgi:hypothetical protein
MCWGRWKIWPLSVVAIITWCLPHLLFLYVSACVLWLKSGQCRHLKMERNMQATQSSINSCPGSFTKLLLNILWREMFLDIWYASFIEFLFYNLGLDSFNMCVLLLLSKCEKIVDEGPHSHVVYHYSFFKARACNVLQYICLSANNIIWHFDAVLDWQLFWPC